MKKWICTALALVMCLALPLTAFAAADGGGRLTPWESEEVKIYVAETFASFEDGEIDGVSEPFWSGGTAANADFAFLTRWQDGQLAFYGNKTGAVMDYFRVAAPEMLETEGVQGSAVGLGAYIENNSENEQALGLFMIGTGCYILQGGYLPLLAAKDGGIEEAEEASAGLVYIPAGFKGYFLVFLEDLFDQWSGNYWEPGVSKILQPGFMLNLQSEEGETFIIDNIFLFGEDLEEKNDGVIEVNKTAAPTPSPTPAPAQTGAPTQAPTQAAPEDKDKGTPPWLWYAVGGGAAAIAVVVCLVLFRKKKQPEGENSGE